MSSTFSSDSIPIQIECGECLKGRKENSMWRMRQILVCVTLFDCNALARCWAPWAPIWLLLRLSVVSVWRREKTLLVVVRGIYSRTFCLITVKLKKCDGCGGTKFERICDACSTILNRILIERRRLINWGVSVGVWRSLFALSYIEVLRCTVCWISEIGAVLFDIRIGWLNRFGI